MCVSSVALNALAGFLLPSSLPWLPSEAMSMPTSASSVVGSASAVQSYDGTRGRVTTFAGWRLKRFRQLQHKTAAVMVTRIDAAGGRSS